MKQSQKPIWRKSMLQSLNLYDIVEYLDEISNNGDMYGYEGDEDGYYQDYKELFDDLSCGAYTLCETITNDEFNIREHWDDMTVALLGKTQNVLGFDTAEQDYYNMLSDLQDWAVEDAEKRLERLTKQELIRSFRKVMTTLVCFFDIKAAHDCLTSIVEELDNRAAMMQGESFIPDRAFIE